MEKSSEQSNNQEFTPTDFDTAQNELNQQVMAEQAGVVRHASYNAERTAAIEAARKKIAYETNPDKIEMPEEMKVTPNTLPPQTDEPIIEGIPEHLQNPQ